VTDLSAAYHATRARISALVAELDDAELARVVPACPEWTVHDLLAHVVGLPEAITSGDRPSDDHQTWLEGLIATRRTASVSSLVERWQACADATSALVDGSGGLLLLDLVTHEQDLRGAVGRPGARGAPEGRAILQAELAALVPGFIDAGLGALVIDAEGTQWASHLVRPGCTLHIDPWEASRVLESRRTAEEILALPATGDIEPYIPVIAGHRPLPTASLGER
jgi:uncharacterized protein (TIGR03083 family)